MGSLMKVQRRTRIAWGWVRLSARTAVLAGTSSTIGAVVPGPHFSQWLFKHWCIGTCKQVGANIEARNMDAVREHGPCVIVANHLSALDIPVLGAVLRGDYRWVAKREVFRIPFVGWHLWASGHIPVDRRAGKTGVVKLQGRFQRAIQSRASILLFPEGTRSQDGALQSFKMGAFQAAVRCGVPVLPVVLDGTQRLATKGAWDLREGADGRVAMHCAGPIFPDQTLTKEEAAKKMREETRAVMVKTLDEIRGAPGAAERPAL